MNTWLIGPLVALLVGDDTQHAWSVEQSRHAPATVLTCEAVVSETLFLLKRAGHDTDDLFTLVDTGFLRTDFDFHDGYRQVRDLMRRYRERPMSFADAGPGQDGRASSGCIHLDAPSRLSVLSQTSATDVVAGDALVKVEDATRLNTTSRSSQCLT